MQRFGINIEQQRLSLTSMSVERECAKATEAKPERAIKAESQEKSSEEPIPIEICRGYSGDHQPELKQF